ncbi:m-AAA protease-interacting protein 1, mitochondrial-like [Daphnia pulicaria]|uniref:m-AAA protease-interacting protein 1, mitochondrial-like n=1 Tax=Daphnia pulicaria TaxID=35523 RepID=UPI001EEB812C|nr:m-AAA protease-interacting protein 1, mitochondrial-like [Daphnia pulicaria]
MTYKLMSSIVRNIFHSRSLVSSRMTCCVFVNRQPSCLPTLEPFQLIENSVKSVHCRSLHTTTSNRLENRNQKLATQLPCLMNNAPHIVWPSIFKGISGMLQIGWIVKPYFDNEFTVDDFLRGAKQAIFIIANAISVGDLESVKEILEEEAYNEIKENMKRCSSEQLAQFALSTLEDVYMTFPYQVGIIMNDNKEGVQERFVEITVCSHIFKGLSELLKNSDFQRGPPTSTFQKHRDKIVICNYRFIREFTKGVEGQWIVNVVHHFNMADDS